MLGREVIYVRCINCSYNNVAKGIRLLDKKARFVTHEKCHASKSFWKIYPFKSFCYAAFTLAIVLTLFLWPKRHVI